MYETSEIHSLDKAQTQDTIFAFEEQCRYVPQL